MSLPRDEFLPRGPEPLELDRRRRLQCAPGLLLIRPAAPAGNPETLASNGFQGASGGSADADLARAEFDGLVRALEAADIETLVLEEPADDPLPDSVFPNNWFTSDSSGTLVLCPMQSPLRRRERRPAFVERIRAAVSASEVLDWSDSEARGQCLEGTGSLILDRVERLVYAALSPRTDRGLVERWAERHGYRALCFETRHGGQPVYHTNVLLSIGARLALFCPAVCVHPQPVLEALSKSGRQVLLLSPAQMESFCANALEVRTRGGGTRWVLSERARGALTAEQLGALAADGGWVSAPLETLERLGGGSARCMLAELWPRIAR